MSENSPYYFSFQKHQLPVQQLFPIPFRSKRAKSIKTKKSYFAFTDLLNENEYQFQTGKRAHALKITPQNAKIYNRMFYNSLGLNIETQEQLKRRANKKRKTTFF